jgi:HEAT repeat protein
MAALKEAGMVLWKYICWLPSLTSALRKTTMTLHQEVEKFKAWATTNYPGEKRYGEWEDDYPAWDALYKATLEFLASSSQTEWDDMDVNDLLYVVARDNEPENLADEVAKEPDRLLRLAGLALTSPETDARWQLATRLGALSDRVQEAEALLLRFVDDKDEYVSRRALLALCDLKSPRAEALAERAWSTGDEYQRLAALSVLEEISSDKLPLYIQRAMEDGREYIVRKAQLIQQA